LIVSLNSLSFISKFVHARADFSVLVDSSSYICKSAMSSCISADMARRYASTVFWVWPFGSLAGSTALRGLICRASSMALS